MGIQDFPQPTSAVCLRRIPYFFITAVSKEGFRAKWKEGVSVNASNALLLSSVDGGLDRVVVNVVEREALFCVAVWCVSELKEVLEVVVDWVKDAGAKVMGCVFLADFLLSNCPFRSFKLFNSIVTKGKHHKHVSVGESDEDQTC